MHKDFDGLGISIMQTEIMSVGVCDLRYLHIVFVFSSLVELIG